MKAGIPVIELDRKTNGDPGKDYTAFIGGDNFKESPRKLGNMLLTSCFPVAATSPFSRVCQVRPRPSSASTDSRRA